MAITGTIAAVGSIAVGAKAANDQKKLGKRALKGADAVQAKQDFYNEMLMDLLKNPSTITNDPGFQFSFGKGLEAVERSNAARGLVGSGQVSVDLLRFGEEFSSRFLQQRENLLAGLSGAGAASSPAQFIGAGVAANSSATDILSQTLGSLGYSFGRGGFGRTSTAGTPGSSGSPTVVGSGTGDGIIADFASRTGVTPFVGPR